MLIAVAMTTTTMMMMMMMSMIVGQLGDDIYIGEKVDIWSLGLLLYRMVFGMLPMTDDQNGRYGMKCGIILFLSERRRRRRRNSV